ncbi:MAG: hypothetical protein HUJ30_09130 [Gammaproteobacteria bacterium]|nr:hypothetical protein [Gammaproteobacteria bacterium]
MKDNGRIRMTAFNNILYCEAYMEGEFTLDDASSILDEARANYELPVDVILYKASTYSVTVEVQLMMSNKLDELRNFVYIVDNETKKASAEFAADTYMKPYNARIASSLDEAYAMLLASV